MSTLSVFGECLQWFVIDFFCLSLNLGFVIPCFFYTPVSFWCQDSWTPTSTQLSTATLAQALISLCCSGSTLTPSLQSLDLRTWTLPTVCTLKWWWVCVSTRKIDTSTARVANRFVGGSCDHLEQKKMIECNVNPVTRFLNFTEKDSEERNNHGMLLCHDTHRRHAPAVPDYK